MRVMRRSDFHYQLPDELIAQRPLAERSASRLMLLAAGEPGPRDIMFRDILHLLRPNDLLVFNNTRVMRARLFGHKATGGRVEILIERVMAPDAALAHVRASKPPKPGSLIELAGGEQLQVVSRDDGLTRVRALGSGMIELMATQGHVPLPPYITREDDAADDTRYQTLFARHEGAVAAPTAGLHFDADLLNALPELGVDRAEVTLHVGTGTFQPVRVDDLDQHVMHKEWLEVNEQVCEKVCKARHAGGRIIAVGTTAVRSLETAALSGDLAPFRGDSQLFIRPGFRFRCVDAMITNFHLPESTLLMLVSAFAGHERILAAYDHAIAERYRFFSYGDAMFLEPEASLR